MKDKLVKTGHKKIYYRFRALSFVALAFLGASAALAAPIAIVGATEQPLFAENGNKNEEQQPIEVEEENPVDLQSEPIE